MFEGDPCIEDTHLNAFALGFFPEGWDAEEFEAPIDRLGGGQHDLVDLEWWQVVDRSTHLATPEGSDTVTELGSDPSHMAERSAGIGISHEIVEFIQINDIFDECRLCLAISLSTLIALSI